MNLTSLFNLKGLAIAFGLGLAAGAASGYFLAVGQYERAALAAAGRAAVAQQAQDLKQHKAAVAEDHKVSQNDALSQRNTEAQVRVVHDTKTVFVKVPAECPADPELDPSVIAAYNKAGH